MDRPLTSEEKLLSIIRKKKGPAAPADKKEETVTSEEKPKEKESRSLNFFMSFLIFWYIFAIVIIMGLIAYVANEVVSYKPTLVVADHGAPAKDDAKDVPNSEQNIIPTTDKSLESYLSAAESRDLFLGPWEKEENSGNPNGEPQLNLSDEVKILGIVLDKDPKVIVEDVKAGQTFFLSKGEAIKGAQLIEIQEDRAIFSYNGKKIELLP